MECKLRCVNFRRVLDPRRPFRSAFRVTGISDDWYRSIMGAIVISLGTPRSSRESFGRTWNHRGGSESPGDKPGSADDKSGSPGNKSGCTSNHSTAVWENNIIFGNAAGVPGNHSYYLSFNNFYNSCIQFVFSSINLCIYIATHLHTVYIDWLQAVLERDSRWAWKWGPSKLSDTLWGHDRARLQIDLEAVIEWVWRCTWRPWLSNFGDALGGHEKAC